LNPYIQGGRYHVPDDLFYFGKNGKRRQTYKAKIQARMIVLAVVAAVALFLVEWLRG